MRLILLAGLLSGAGVVLPRIGVVFPDGLFAGLTFFVVAAAFIARIISQPETLGGDDARQ
ncbi:DUF7940 domain-containing protein [Xanthobacter wiegelii]|uniref:DUF7940 domain-containing protein n=1 Tax=Xanthobacter wiegelii TaxID=3119913 RepID=UPI004040B494